jgi:hypothetical protein
MFEDVAGPPLRLDAPGASHETAREEDVEGRAAQQRGGAPDEVDAHAANEGDEPLGEAVRAHRLADERGLAAADALRIVPRRAGAAAAEASAATGEAGVRPDRKDEGAPTSRS